MRIEKNLALERCPHCSVHKPNLVLLNSFNTAAHDLKGERFWGIYSCSTCGSVVTAGAPRGRGHVGIVSEVYPSHGNLSSDIPQRPFNYLQQAIDSLHAPSGAVMLCASSVDAMLKEKEYLTGSLYKRIDQAVEENLMTSDMASWAHDVRLDANDERHADEDAEMPTTADAKRAVDFTKALAEFLFVLPAKVQRGLKKD
ncbi:hypothetical protein A9Q81_24215 [Gammaproteobacteria bacterium 42_54_T18]|nr:hypothetical protein A9Q81_24215 [Gammaproteobacteria bacterium 42_54_T18]